MSTSNLHLVDEHGQPLPHHITEAVKRIEPRIYSRFLHRCDPAELSNSLEEGARRIAQHEQKKGSLSGADHLGRFTWRTLLNAGVSLLRKRRREQLLSSEQLRNLPVTDGEHSPEVISARLEGAQILAELSERDRQICDLEVQGLDDSEIAEHLQISKEALYQARHRRRAKVAAFQAQEKSKNST
jgi:DNA-directed RNA polymerase specialized sigma24 family protein